MAAFKPDLDKLKELYERYGADLFALCYLQTGRPVPALDLMVASLCDMASSPKLWEEATSSREGFLRVGHLNCVDASLRRPKRRKKSKGAPLEDAPRAKLPFSLTEPLRRILKLRLPARTALFCQARLGLSWEETGRLLGVSPRRAQRLGESALKKGKITLSQAQANLADLAPGPDNPEKVWQEFETQQRHGGFAARQSLRRARRAMDVAVPFLAVGVIALCVAAYIGVDQGWFGTSSVPAQETVQENTSTSDTLAIGDVSVYVPEEGGYVEYIVHNTPYAPEDILRQMVYLGGAPAGTTLLSARVENLPTQTTSDGQILAEVSAMWELSKEAASLTGEEGERMLQAMVATIAAYTDHLGEISIRCQGEELTVNGKTAQDLLGQELTITRTVETDYRE